ncbi:hypothetical protein [Roseiconus lacunae]|uniref:Uncharacterized protein n=1 Tax=Roseiconus lacunae TaxID=2605694 RepID=A0ABT7PS81_9BACT|nr:hypothetical protein [Roseiconus lacunae]MDM4019363.1 hypothetical protein [Roseiconus lacunae]
MTKRKTGVGWWVLLTVLVTAILSPVLFCYFRRNRAFQELKKQRAKLLSRGLPVDHETLKAFRYQSMPHELSMRWTDILTELDSEAFFESGARVPIVGYLEDEQEFVPVQPYPYHDVVDQYLHQHRDLVAELHSVTERSGP